MKNHGSIVKDKSLTLPNHPYIYVLDKKGISCLSYDMKTERLNYENIRFKSEDDAENSFKDCRGIEFCYNHPSSRVQIATLQTKTSELIFWDSQTSRFTEKLSI